MRIIFSVITILLLLSCGDDNSKKTEKINIDSSPGEATNSKSNIDTAAWINSFKEFRTAIYQEDKSKVKMFIDFPINNENNDIWYVAYEGDYASLKLAGNEITPFPESEFDKHYSKIFPLPFIIGILKIKTDSLLSEGNYETTEFKEKETIYTIYASYDNKARTFNLNLLSKTPITVNDGEKDIVEMSEYSLLYYFQITDNNTIKFTQLRAAG